MTIESRLGKMGNLGGLGKMSKWVWVIADELLLVRLGKPTLHASYK